MSQLFGLARQASEYVHNRFQKQYRDLDRAQDAAQDGRDPQWKDQLRRTLLSHFGQQTGGSNWQNDLKKSLQQGLSGDDDRSSARGTSNCSAATPATTRKILRRS